MLVLSRQVSEIVRIRVPKEAITEDGYVDVTVMLVALQVGRAKLGLHAPREVTIHREEIWKAIEGETADEEERSQKAAWQPHCGSGTAQ